MVNEDLSSLRELVDFVSEIAASDRPLGDAEWGAEYAAFIRQRLGRFLTFADATLDQRYEHLRGDVVSRLRALTVNGFREAQAEFGAELVECDARVAASIALLELLKRVAQRIRDDLEVIAPA